MAKKQRNKLKQSEIDKIKARYENQLDWFKHHTLDELKVKFNTEKMSSTDRHALVMATNHLMKEEAEKALKENEVTKESE